MPHYNNIREEELKNKVAEDWFGGFDHTKIIGNIDFAVSLNSTKQNKTQSLFWAEAKRGIADSANSIAQLILTIGKAKMFADTKYPPPNFLGCFDYEKIAFIPYNKVLDIFYMNDFNWNVAPSNQKTKEFKLIKNKIEEFKKSFSIFDFDFEKKPKKLKEFIAKHFVVGKNPSKITITKNNFTHIYYEWSDSVAGSIGINWKLYKEAGIIDGDFFLADLLSTDGNDTILKKLSVLLQNDVYKIARGLDKFSKKELYSNFYFNDNQKAHKQFWNDYKRPPKKDYWDYIVNRRDLLVPQDIRERKGSYFTPQKWVKKSQEYIADTLGENWQDEYYVWDCAAGTGNLLKGLTNRHNIFASTIDYQDIKSMHQIIKNKKLNLLPAHCFQFDFLNDGFDKLPSALQEIINDPEKIKKLVVYINPPYAEAGNVKQLKDTGENKSGVTKGNSNAHLEYKPKISTAANEIFALFTAKIYEKLNGCTLVKFSTLKILQGSNFRKFRDFFRAKFLKGFIVPAKTFDNVSGEFPIGLTIYDTGIKEKLGDCVYDIYDIFDKFDKEVHFIGTKKIYGDFKKESMNKWFNKFNDKNNRQIGVIINQPSDFQNSSKVAILTKPQKRYCNNITLNNLIQTAIYFAVRHCIKATWLNDRDQFLTPNDGWQKDKTFQNDCLAFTLLHHQNRITSQEGVNHWIPFTEQEVDARSKFDSNFMTDFMSGKLKPCVKKEAVQHKLHGEDVTNDRENFIPKKPLVFSTQAQAVFMAGKELWRYYHRQKNANVNASFYDIKAHFQGFSEKNGKKRMNAKSSDETYTALLKDLKTALKILAEKIEPKIFKYGFLLKD